MKRNLLSEPRIIMRGIIGTLLVANLVAAVIAFKPFGGSAEDMRREQQALGSQLAQAQKSLGQTQQLAAKVQRAREEGDRFVDKYILDSHLSADLLYEELNRLATLTQVKPGGASYNLDPVEGSETLEMMTISEGFEGDYAKLVRFMELVDKSPRFLIIDNLQAAAPQQQGGKVLNVTLKVKAFVRSQPGAAL